MACKLSRRAYGSENQNDHVSRAPSRKNGDDKKFLSKIKRKEIPTSARNRYSRTVQVRRDSNLVGNKVINSIK